MELSYGGPGAIVTMSFVEVGMKVFGIGTKIVVCANEGR